MTVADRSSPATCAASTDIGVGFMLIRMRTTLDIDDALMRKVKEFARRANRTATDVIEAAIQGLLARSARRPKGFKLRLAPVRGQLRPGVDLADRDALYDRMQDRT